MPLVFSADARRQAAFERIQNDTLEVLAYPAVEDALEEQGSLLARALESAFVVPKVAGRLCMPPEQLDTDNIGIHPILFSELRMPAFPVMDFLSPADKALVQDEERLLSGFQSKHQEKQIGRWATIKSIENQDPHVQILGMATDKTEPPTIILARPIVKIRTTSILGASKLALGGLMAHEMDHGLKIRDIDEIFVLRSLLLKSAADRQYAAATAVLFERLAYEVTEKIMSSQAEPPVSASYIYRSISGLSPEEAALAVKAFLPKIAIAGRPRQHDIHLSAIMAGVLTKTFGDGSDMPTPAEIKAYQSANLVNAAT